MILGMLKHLGVECPLRNVGLAGKFTPNVCSGHRPSLEGTLAIVRVEFLHAWVLLVPVTPSVGTDVVSSSPLILLTEIFNKVLLEDKTLAPIDPT